MPVRAGQRHSPQFRPDRQLARRGDGPHTRRALTRCGGQEPLTPPRPEHARVWRRSSRRVATGDCRGRVRDTPHLPGRFLSVTRQLPLRPSRSTACHVVPRSTAEVVLPSPTTPRYRDASNSDQTSILPLTSIEASLNATRSTSGRGMTTAPGMRASLSASGVNLPRRGRVAWEPAQVGLARLRIRFGRGLDPLTH